MEVLIQANRFAAQIGDDTAGFQHQEQRGGKIPVGAGRCWQARRPCHRKPPAPAGGRAISESARSASIGASVRPAPAIAFREAAIRAPDSFARPDIARGLPFSQAPPPERAVQSSSRTGLNRTPAAGPSPVAIPIETTHSSLLSTNARVPSIGSTIKVRSAVRRDPSSGCSSDSQPYSGLAAPQLLKQQLVDGDIGFGDDGVVGLVPLARIAAKEAERQKTGLAGRAGYEFEIVLIPVGHVCCLVWFRGGSVRNRSMVALPDHGPPARRFRQVRRRLLRTV